MSYGKKGYEPGKPNSFTPTVNAPWITTFNEMLKEYNDNGLRMSRNRLTEKLIEDGLKYNQRTVDNRNDLVTIDTDDLDSDQINILNSVQGQQMLKSVIRVILAQLSSSSVSVPNVELAVAAENTDVKKEQDYQAAIVETAKESKDKVKNPILERAQRIRGGLKI